MCLCNVSPHAFEFIHGKMKQKFKILSVGLYEDAYLTQFEIYQWPVWPIYLSLIQLSCRWYAGQRLYHEQDFE